jgi:hypothetical protein
MTFFADSQQLYACVQALLVRVQEQHPDGADAILASRLVIRLSTSDPELELTINGRRRPVQISYGPSKLRSTLDIEMEADTLHRILLGEQSLKKAFAGGLLKVAGPVWRTADLAVLLDYGRLIYPQVLREQGLAPEFA